MSENKILNDMLIQGVKWRLYVQYTKHALPTSVQSHVSNPSTMESVGQT